MATAGNGVSIGTTDGATAQFDARSTGGEAGYGGDITFYISNRSSSTNNLLVNIPGIHKSGEWLGMGPGVTLPFRNSPKGIDRVYMKSDSGTVTVDYGVQGRV